MKVCVFGLWHLGSVTAACLAAAKHQVIGLDFDRETITKLNMGEPPLFEPGLAELITKGLAEKTLQFTDDAAEALKDADVLWVTFDTPVDDDDNADVEAVINHVKALFPYLSDNTLILISSQLRVGSTARLEQLLLEAYPDKQIQFAYSPENLRLGKAIDVFNNPDRIIVGVRNGEDRQTITQLLSPITDRIEWMGVESAEMTKHALNAFLATSVAFINEIATICERIGADAREVERGLKTESRIGPRAYLGPGGAFAGGTLARDIAFLQDIGQQVNVPVDLIESVETSNNNHKSWAFRRLTHLLEVLDNKTIAVLGLTYKPNTDTLRRSSAVELCRQLHDAGATVQAFDPMIKTLPDELQSIIMIKDSIETALENADALVIMTEWSQFKEIDLEQINELMHQPIVLDANRFLGQSLGSESSISYYTVGKS